LTEFKSSEQFSENSAFDIFDITGNGSPELIISSNSESTAKCTVYTYDSGEFAEIGETGFCGIVSYCPENKLLKNEYQGNGFVIGNVVAYVNGAFDTVLTYSDNMASASMGAEIYHEINGGDASLPEYEKALAPYAELECICAGRRYTFGDSVIKYALRCSESWQAVISPEQKRLCIDKLTEVLQLTLDDGTDPAFDLCDLNGDKVPELIISDGSNHEAECSVYYFSDGNLVEMDGKYGADGVISFDTKNYVFFANKETGKSYWSIANTSFSSNEYTESDSKAAIGRKHLLNENSILAVFN
ncbi:MAG: hypothetical protein K2G87_07030, partial [Oscillospiraceae bacterium]|nr:hypothetical protein [Oscillospiraceae bacterium]